MSKHPKVSVIIPTYNRAHLIGKAIKSVLNQTFQDFEIIVIDDGSTDNTEEIVKGFNNFKIRYISHNNNRGVSSARNTGIRASRGEYVALLDSDDEWLSEKLDKQIKVFKSEFPEVGVVYTGHFRINEKDGNKNRVYIPKKKGYIYEHLLSRNCVLCTSALLMKKECFNKVGLFDENFLACGDFDMWIRIAKYYRFDFAKTPLVIRRMHHNQLSSNSEARIAGVSRIQVKHVNELKKRPYSYSIRFFNLGKKLCHLGKIREGQRYFIKAILIYPFCVKYYIYLLSSLFGPKCFIYFVNIKRYLTNLLMKYIGKIRKITYNKS